MTVTSSGQRTRPHTAMLVISALSVVLVLALVALLLLSDEAVPPASNPTGTTLPADTQPPRLPAP